MSRDMVPCTNPSLCGAQEHHVSTVSRCKLMERAGIGAAGLGFAPPALSIPNSMRPESKSNDIDRVAALAALSMNGRGMDWLTRRWNTLDKISPTVNVAALPQRDWNQNGDESASSYRTKQTNVDAALIVAHDSDGSDWGEVNNRPESFDKIIHGARAGYSDWTERMESDPMNLEQTVGPYGPVYSVGAGGRHRASVIKAMGIQSIEASVNPPSRPIKQGDTYSVRMSSKDAELYARAGYLENWYTEDTREMRLPAQHGEAGRDIDIPWEVGPPDQVAAFSQAYKRVYPHFGSTPKERAMLTEEGWRSYLEKAGEARSGPKPSRLARWRKRTSSGKVHQQGACLRLLSNRPAPSSFSACF